MYYIYLLMLTLTIFSCTPATPEAPNRIEIIDDFSILEERLNSDTTKTWVVNFWATTCPPCLQEMPHFNALYAQNNSNDMNILLVSLDSEKSYDKRVVPFVKKHKIVPEVIHLTDDNFSAWTDKVDASWFGALPATLIIKGKKRNFQFGMYETLEELSRHIEQVQ